MPSPSSPLCVGRPDVPARARAVHGGRPRGPLALAPCLVLALQLGLSALWLARESHHECQGEGCPICRTMAQVARVAGRGALPAGPAPRPVGLPAPASVLAIVACCVTLARKTPIDLGVRLDI